LVTANTGAASKMAHAYHELIRDVSRDEGAMSVREVEASAVELFEHTVRTATSPRQVENFLDSLPGTPRYTAIRVYFVYHDGDLVHFLLRRAERRAGLTGVNPEAGGFALQRTYGREHVRAAQGILSVLPSTVDHIFRMVTISRSDFWDRAVHRFVRDTYPALVRVFFRQAELRTALSDLQSHLDPARRLMVEDFSVRERRLAEEVPASPVAYDSGRKWTHMTVSEAFDEALERQQWFRSIGFRLEHQRSPSRHPTLLASGRVYKHGHLHVNGLYADFAAAMLPALERAGHERLKLFANRGKTEREYRPARPLQLVFGRPVFDNRDNMRQFTETLMRYPRATKALLHSNPYLHASVADFLDGSSLDVWILSATRVLLIPQAKASVAALQRLTEYIFSEFREGEVGEYISGQ